MTGMVLLLANLAATGVMIGLIWTVQLVHYPLFARVGTAAWPAYAADHARRITVLAGPWMVLEAATAFALLLRPPAGVPVGWLRWGFVLVCGLWLLTGLVSGPLFTRLSSGWDPALHRRLVRTNWLRTALWTARGALLLVLSGQLLLGPRG